MNAMGRQMQQSGTAVQHQRQHQYSENGVDASGDAVFGKWLQSAGLQHLAAAAANFQQDCSGHPFQSVENKQKMGRTGRSCNGGVEFFSEPSTPPVYSRSSSQKNMEGLLSPRELSPGILDLHSIDTELLSEVSLPGLYDSTSPFISLMEKGIENDSELFFSANKQQNRMRVLTENNQLRAVPNDRDRNGALAKIKVVVRKRPLNKKEISRKEEDIITIEPNCASLTVNETKLKVDLTAYVEKHEFVFDAVLDDQVSNEEVYRVTVEPIVPAIFQRTKATCFAYGQTDKFPYEKRIKASDWELTSFPILTCLKLGALILSLMSIGSGKTFTMQPLPLKASQDILRIMQQAYRNQGFQLCVSFFEIYGGKLYDLLNERRKLCMREDGKQQVCIVGLQEFRVSDVDSIKDLIEKGNTARSTGTTGANEESSRSHAILQLVIKRSVEGSESKPGRVMGKLSFIDLAGSERGADTTDNDRQTRMEGAEINKSLLALKECIRALDNDQGHIPFRGSKLTEVLRDSFVGDSRTIMISCISPNSGSCEHTLNTLRYADRVKSLSKANNSKKDSASPVLSLRESTTGLTFHSHSLSAPEHNSFDLMGDSNRFGWHKQSVGESRHLFTMDHGPPSGRDNGWVGSVYAETRDTGSNALCDEYDSSTAHESQEQDRPVLTSPWRRGKPEMDYKPKDEAPKANMAADRECTDASGTVHTKLRSKDMMDSDMDMDPDEDLDAILKQEEDLVIAHRKQVEDTIDIVREEMKLLSEADQPGNQIDGYISKLNDILSQKAAGIVRLQSQLARFQRLLRDQNVLTSPSGFKPA